MYYNPEMGMDANANNCTLQGYAQGDVETFFQCSIACGSAITGVKVKDRCALEMAPTKRENPDYELPSNLHERSSPSDERDLPALP